MSLGVSVFMRRQSRLLLLFGSLFAELSPTMLLLQPGLFANWGQRWGCRREQAGLYQQVNAVT